MLAAEAVVPTAFLSRSTPGFIFPLKVPSLWMRFSGPTCKEVFLSGFAMVLLVAVLAWTNRMEIRFVLDFESIGKNAQGHPEYRHRKAGFVIVRLPGQKPEELNFYLDSSHWHRSWWSPYPWRRN